VNKRKETNYPAYKVDFSIFRLLACLLDSIFRDGNEQTGQGWPFSFLSNFVFLLSSNKFGSHASLYLHSVLFGFLRCIRRIKCFPLYVPLLGFRFDLAPPALFIICLLCDHPRPHKTCSSGLQNVYHWRPRTCYPLELGQYFLWFSLQEMWYSPDLRLTWFAQCWLVYVIIGPFLLCVWINSFGLYVLPLWSAPFACTLVFCPILVLKNKEKKKKRKSTVNSGPSSWFLFTLGICDVKLGRFYLPKLIMRCYYVSDG